MKKTGLFAILALLCLALGAQNTLQFNQVINIDLTGSVPASGGDYLLQTANVTVPAGKVWKVEFSSCRLAHASYPTLLYANHTNNAIVIFLDNVPISDISNNGYNARYGSQPAWLTAGAHTFQLRVYNYAGSAMTGYGKVTAIEFNVVP